jgi:toxin YoeB
VGTVLGMPEPSDLTDDQLVDDDALRDPTDGIAKPEPLKHLLAGAWSRRIIEEHRLVYLVDHDDLVILQAHFGYR